jgi:hypothetical protein
LLPPARDPVGNQAVAANDDRQAWSLLRPARDPVNQAVATKGAPIWSLLRPARDRVRMIPAGLRRRRHLRYLRDRRPSAFAPYDRGIYRRLLGQIRASGVHTPPFTAAPATGADGPQLYLRHDVDLPACVPGLPALIDADLAAGLPAAVYIRTDGEAYDPRELAGTVERYRAAGIEFGLHSSCYARDDVFAAFAEELERFRGAFGFWPDSFTMHGLGDHRLDTRLRFCAEIAGRLQEFGLRFSDCHASLREYRYALEDCHRDPGSGRRFIYDDFRRLPRFFEPGGSYLVLTHPGYWR